MSTHSDVVVVVAGGLGAIKPGADWYYRRLCRCLGAELVILHGAGFGPASKTYEHFEAELDRLSQGGKKLVIVGHSLGGINAVFYAASHANVAHLILIGVPVLGSAWLKLARYLEHTIEHYVPILHDLAPGSSLLAEFDHALMQVAPTVTCIEAVFDIFVVPAGACHVPGAHDYLILRAPWINHVTMIAHRRVLELSLDIVSEAEAVLDQAKLPAFTASP